MEGQTILQRNAHLSLKDWRKQSEVNFTIYISAFLLGIGGSLHCLGMCGPLVMAVPFQSSSSKHLSMITYLVGKALAYTVLGVIMGLLGAGLFLMEWQQVVSIIAGVLIILMVIFPYLKPSFIRFPWQNTMSKILKNIGQNPRWYYYLSLGFLNGLLPCGLVYVALTTAVASGSPISGALAMFIFGIGTMPILLATMILKTKVSLNKQKSLKLATTVVSLLVGLVLIIRGMNLGIPYLSPHFDHKHQTVKGCCEPKS